MSNTDNHLIFEQYSTKSPEQSTPDDIVYETIEQTLNLLEGKGFAIRPKFSSKELYNLLLKPRNKDQQKREVKVDRDEQHEDDDREMRLMQAMQKFGHGTDYNTPFEETDHSKDDPALAPGDKRQEDGSVVDKDGKVVYTPKPKVAKEGSKGSQSDREKADVDDDGEIEPWEKKRANAIRKSQGKPHLCAKTVMHETYGPGHTVHARHAHPDVNGNIAWYVCEFKHGVACVNTDDIDIVTIVEHNH